jgi:hypothetical protein
MYNQVLASTGAGAILAGSTGVWWLMGAFALVAAGTALARIVPRKVEK